MPKTKEKPDPQQEWFRKMERQYPGFERRFKQAQKEWRAKLEPEFKALRRIHEDDLSLIVY